MTVNDLIVKLKAYSRAAPHNGLAQLMLRDRDGETCSNIDSALDCKGMPGQHFLVLTPCPGSFKLQDAMKVQ